jgi:predicted DsbA family dithiol-disulfide isomerase
MTTSAKTSPDQPDPIESIPVKADRHEAEPPTPIPIRIDFVSDVACPWCAVGLKSLEQALERIGDRLAVTLCFQPFELNPQMPPEGEDATEHLMRKYGSTPEQLERNREVLRARGAELGFVFNKRERIYNTFDAHRLLHWAALEGRALELKHALLQAYLTDGEDVSSARTLLRLAKGVGLNEQRAQRLLATDLYAGDVRAQERHYIEHGINSVPSVIINRRHLIQGGQPVETFERALRRIAGLDDVTPAKN